MVTARPAAWHSSRWLRLGLPALIAAAVGHWLWERQQATRTAAQLQGAVVSLAACVTEGRPPEAIDPDSARILQQQVFRRLALSLPDARPLARCEALASAAASQAREHQRHLYHRAPAEVRELAELTARLQAFDAEATALELSRRPEPSAPPSPTLGLIADLARGLQLACQIAQAERAFDTGTCPNQGAAAQLPTSRPAFVSELPEPVQRFELRPLPHPPGSAGARATLAVSLFGRRGARRHWVAVEPPPDQAGAGWTALAPADGQSLGLSRVAWRGDTLVEASAEGLRLMRAASDGTLSVSLALPGPMGAPGAQPNPPGAAGAGATHGAAAPSVIVPELGDPALWPQPGGPAWLSYDPTGVKLTSFVDGKVSHTVQQRTTRQRTTQQAPQRRTVQLKGQLERVGAHGALLREPSTDSLAYLSPQGEPIAHLTLPGELLWQGRALTCGDAEAQLVEARRDAGGGPAGSIELFLVTLTERAVESRAVPRQAPSPTLLCDRGAPKLLRSSAEGVSIRDPKTGAELKLSTPVAFDAAAAATVTAAGGPQGLVVSYLLGGVLVAQRLTAEGSSEPTLLAHLNERGAPATPRVLVRPSGAWLVVFRRHGGSTRASQLRLEVLESADGLSWR
ncbi:MAG: hypothetical protein KIT72_14370 [Polyangiaceae bacterium]|nr:hypothetical protein [Polyangiaceae bacterium]MCW5791599.1 hypothetical protein [Polyangiaceae bacterium]